MANSLIGTLKINLFSQIRWRLYNTGMNTLPSKLSADVTLVDKIDALLPQTQCRRCDFAGCRPYAEAIAAGDADINQCPPGGDKGIIALANLLGVEPKPLNPRHGEEGPLEVAFIVEEDCIGCVKCIQACPVDAIIGASKQMHTVLTDECTGCKLCIPPCPMDCILMRPPSSGSINNAIDSTQRADYWRQRYDARLVRLERNKRERQALMRQKKDALKKRTTVTGASGND